MRMLSFRTPVGIAGAALVLGTAAVANAQTPPPPPAPPPPVTATATTTVSAPPPAPAAGEVGQYGPEAGRKGLSFGIPSGGGTTVGFAYLLSNDAALRLDVGLDIPLKQTVGSAGFGFSVDAGYRMYMWRIGNLSPFVQPGLFMAKPAADSSFNQFALALTGGVGAEYFFWNEFSISGQTGIAFTTTNKFNDIKLNTGTTALLANFYFR